MVFPNSDGTTTSFDYAIEGKPYAIFDSGTAALMIPPKYYVHFICNIFAVASELKGGETISYKSEGAEVQFDCKYEEYFLPITFLM